MMTSSREYRLSLIVAMASNRVIGAKNRLPWHLPEDLKRFRELTMGCTIIMGRKTFDSIGRALPGRLNLVVTRQKDWRPTGVGIDQGTLPEGTQIAVSHSLPEAIEMAKGWISEQCRTPQGKQEIFVIGGSELFCESLAIADRIYLTHIEKPIEGDVFFPDFEPARFRVTEQSELLRSAGEEGLHYRFEVLDRV